MTLRTVGVRLTAEVAEYQSKLRAAAQTTKDFKGELDKASKKGSLDKVADTAGIVGVSLLGMAGVAVKSAADFDKAMSGVSVGVQDASGHMGELRAAALQAGKDTMYSATQAADGITELGKAGIQSKDILGGGLKGALDLAAAGQLSVGEAASVAASAMTQFKLSGEQVPHVADLLAAGAGKAQGSVHDMGQALNQSGLVAAQFGLSIEDTTGVLAEFANAGLVGSDAGTSLRTMLLSLANPSKQTQGLMDQLGISFYDASGKFVGMSGVAEVLRQRLKGLTDAQRQQALGQIFGNDAIRSASILYTDGAAGVDKWKNAVNDSGYAAATAQKQTNNLAGDIERLKGSLETVFIEAGSNANGGLRLLVKTLNEVVDRIGAMSPATTGTMVVLGALTGVLFVGGSAWLKYKKFVAEAQEQLIATGPAGEKAAAGLSKVTSILGKVGMWSALAEGISLALDQIEKKTIDVDHLTDAVKNLLATGNSAGELKNVFGSDWDKLGDIAGMANDADHGFGHFAKTVKDAVPGLGDAAYSSLQFGERLAGIDWDSAKQHMAGLDTAVSTNIQSINDYNKASQLWQQMLTKSGLDSQQLAELLPNTYKELQKESAAAEHSAGSINKYSGSAAAASGKLGDLNSALALGADAQDKYATEADAVAGAARGERAALDALHRQLKAETDPVFALIEAQSKLRDAQKAYTAAVKQHGAKSSEAKDADIKLAQAALDLQGAVGGVSNSFNGKLDPAFRATLKAAGLTDTQIKQVERSFDAAKKSADKYSGDYKANVSAPGAPKAKKDIDNAFDAAHHFAGPYVADLRISGAAGVHAEFRKLSAAQQALKSGNTIDRLHLATGGPVFGAGTATSDSVPAMLSAGEHVWTAAEVQAAGGHGAVMAMRSMAVASKGQITAAAKHNQVPDIIRALFASGELGRVGDLPIPGLAGGGPVWPFPVTVAHTRVPSWDEVLSHMPGGMAAPFLHAQDGKPYIWASAGPDGYDCSGIASAVYQLLHGKYPYSHIFSTDSLPGPWFPKPGIGGPLTVAWSNPGEYPASSATGHMMGMAGGLTFESTGSRGVHLGASTRSLHDFAHIAHYARGGPVGSHLAMAGGGMITEPVFGVGASGRTYSFGENYQPERVVPMWQSSTAGGSRVTVNATIPITLGAETITRQVTFEVDAQLGKVIDATVYEAA